MLSRVKVATLPWQCAGCTSYFYAAYLRVLLTPVRRLRRVQQRHGWACRRQWRRGVVRGGAAAVAGGATGGDVQGAGAAAGGGLMEGGGEGVGYGAGAAAGGGCKMEGECPAAAGGGQLLEVGVGGRVLEGGGRCWMEGAGGGCSREGEFWSSCRRCARCWNSYWRWVLEGACWSGVGRWAVVAQSVCTQGRLQRL